MNWFTYVLDAVGFNLKLTGILSKEKKIKNYVYKPNDIGLGGK